MEERERTRKYWNCYQFADSFSGFDLGEIIAKLLAFYVIKVWK